MVESLNFGMVYSWYLFGWVFLRKLFMNLVCVVWIVSSLLIYFKSYFVLFDWGILNFLEI